MKAFVHIIVLVFALTMFLFLTGFSQDKDIRQLNKTAIKYFFDEEYDKALPIFLQLDSLKPDDFEINYKIGACYLNRKYENNKAIPYLEKAIKIKGESLIPQQVFKDLGMLYHLNYQFNKAIHSYMEFLKICDKDDEDIDYVKRMVEVCKNAKILISDTLDLSIENIGSPINTEHYEFCPLISADKSIMFFTRNIKKQNADIDSVQQIMVSYKEYGEWKTPDEIKFNFPDTINISLAGISPDGEQLFILLDGNIYTCQLEEGVDLKKFSEPGISQFLVERLSFTADGRELYFSSNKPGGYGGKDIYKIVKDESESWGEPVNLGPDINSIYDEDFPFIHPDKKTLYFSSEGHNTIGGYDIFKTTLNDSAQWSEPENIGFPINTTKDDIYFVLSADGKKGYFSSSRDNNYSIPDIFEASFDNNIPLTMVKGTILAGKNLKPVNAKIKVIDNETNERVKYIYNPNPQTGKYLMIFPPGKNYSMIIDAQGYLPNMVNIYIPDQTSFFELFQEIHLKPVKLLGEVVGEKITIKNTFYDIYKTIDTLVSEDKDYGNVLKLITDLVQTTDSLSFEEFDSMWEQQINVTSDEDTIIENKYFDNLLNLIEDAIETTDSVALSVLAEKTIYDEKGSQTYFYAEAGKLDNMNMTIVGQDTIYTIPPIDMSTILAEKEQIDTKDTKKSERKIILTYQVFFDSENAIIEEKYFDDMKQISYLLINNSELGIEINSYADSKQDAEQNMILSGQRAKSVLDVFINNEIDTNKIILIPYINYMQEDIEEINNRVDIKIFEVTHYTDTMVKTFISHLTDEDNLTYLEFTTIENLDIDEVEIGEEIKLNYILFETGKATLTPVSYPELDLVVQFLSKNKNVKIEIAGHTDNIGSDKDNLNLSQARAQTVADYFILQGINKKRMIVKGYGKTKPIASNDTEEGRQHNRRVMFTILKK